MLSQKEIEERVRRGLEDDERWKIIVRKNNWLCPYCGKIGARELSMDEAIEAKIALHFRKGCERWRDFEAEPLAIERLRLRAKLIVFKTRVARWIQEERRFRLADESGRWLCPYCARETALAPPRQGLDEPPEWGVAPEEEPFVDGVARHLLECASFAKGEDALLPAHELEAKRARSSGKARRARIRERFEREPSFRVVGRDGRWVCPYCAGPTEVVLGSPEGKPDDEFLDGILGHLSLCKAHRKHDSAPRPLEALEASAGEGGRRSRLAELAATIKKHASWRARDEAGTWHCPYCALATGARFPEARAGQAFDAFVEAAQDHLSSCLERAKGGETKSRSALSRALDRSNARLRLRDEIGRKLREDSLFGITDELEDWACPYCKKVQKAIRLGRKGESAVLEKTVEQIVSHLERDCEGWSSGEQPRVSRAELEKIARSGARSSGTTDARVVGDGRKPARGNSDDWKRLKKEVEDVRSRVEHASRRMLSLREARSTQRRILPTIPEIPGYEFACVYRPCEDVGGDFYDFVRVDEGRIGLAIGDIAGHGIEAALLMGLAKKLLEVHGRGRASAAEALALANADLFPDLDEKTFVTAFYGILETETRRLRFARAGHDPLVVYNPERRPSLQVHDSRGMALGMDEGAVFQESIEELELELRPGDLLLQYTDGVTEAMSPKEGEFGFERLRAVLEEHGGNEAEYVLWKIERALDAWMAGSPPKDDITLLAVRVLEA